MLLCCNHLLQEEELEKMKELREQNQKLTDENEKYKQVKIQMHAQIK